MVTIESLANKRALSSKERFLEDLGGAGVLIRLDERGGNDEPAPWAFHGIPRAAVLPPREDEEVDVRALRKTLADAAEEETNPMNASLDAFTDSAPDVDTQTAERPKMLPLPPARGAASVFVLSQDAAEQVVGRVDAAEICISERSISRRHAILRRQGETLRLCDLGGSNGTAINDREIDVTGQELLSGDVVTFGDVRCLYLSALEFYTYLPRLSD